MRKTILLLVTPVLIILKSYSQTSGIAFSSTDTALVRTFEWAKRQALFYKGNPADPVGPWYEAALPSRYAFCMRDASHQSIGAEILGMSAENRNMFRKFAENISESKKWCSYWEINKENKPAPVDYLNDNDFWYNLNANFDVVYACRRLYDWTADEKYISDPVFLNFYQRSMDEYVETWKLQADSLLSRPKNLNADPEKLKRFRRGYGLPSYAESVPNLAMSTDLIAAIYQGYVSYAGILASGGIKDKSQAFLAKAFSYSDLLESKWWDPAANLYNTWYLYDGKFGKGEGEAYLLWFNILKDTAKIRHTVTNLSSKTWTVENTSYFPLLMYRNGYWDKAYKYLLFCSNPSTKRREYPEVSYGVIEGIVSGLMGVDPNADLMSLSTIHRVYGDQTDEIRDLPVLSTIVSLKHTGTRESEFQNNGSKLILWKARFYGEFVKASAGKKTLSFSHENETGGGIISYVEIQVKPGDKIRVKVKR